MGSSTGSASDRINALLDENSFVEIGAKVTARSTDFNLKQTSAPSDGVVTGYGSIDGKPVYVYSQDASVLGGSLGEMHANKIKKIYDLALKCGAPVIGIIDSTGLRLQESTDALNALAEVYASQVYAKGVILQITAVFGNCGGGLALVPAISDFTFVEDNGKLFVNSPNAVDGNYTEKCDTSSAKFQFEESGNADFTGDADSIYANIRKLVSILPSNDEDAAVTDSEDDLNRSVPDITGCAGDTAILLSQVADDNDFVEVKAGYAKEMVTGFIRLDGMTIGCVANRNEVIGDDGKVAEKFDGVLTVKGLEKAADFVYFCDSFGIPVLTVTNVKGFCSCMCAEKKIARAAAELTAAFANCDVPRVNLIVGKALGSAYSIMNSKGLGCDLTYAWPDAQIGPMDAKLAAKLMYDGESASVIDEKAGEYAALQNNAESAAKRGYVDTIIAPEDTRKHLVYAFEMLFA